MDLRDHGVELEGDPAWMRSTSSVGPPPPCDGRSTATESTPALPRWDYTSILDPGPAGRRFTAQRSSTGSSAPTWTSRSPLRRRARRSGVRAAIEIWYAARRVLGLVLQYGGFEPQSHKRLVEEVPSRAFKRVAFGPPIVNIEKLAALDDAGMIDSAAGAGVERGPRRGRRAASSRDRRCSPGPSPASTSLSMRALSRLWTSPTTCAAAAQPSPSRNDQGVREPVGDPGVSRRIVRAPSTWQTRRGSSSARTVRQPNVAVIGIPTEGNLVGNATMERAPVRRQVGRGGHAPISACRGGARRRRPVVARDEASTHGSDGERCDEPRGRARRDVGGIQATRREPAPFSTVITDRHCKRAFVDREVPREILERVLRAAAHAPSSRNTQSWHAEVLSGERPAQAQRPALRDLRCGRPGRA